MHTDLKTAAGACPKFQEEKQTKINYLIGSWLPVKHTSRPLSPQLNHHIS